MLVFKHLFGTLVAEIRVESRSHMTSKPFAQSSI